MCAHMCTSVPTHAIAVLAIIAHMRTSVPTHAIAVLAIIAHMRTSVPTHAIAVPAIIAHMRTSVPIHAIAVLAIIAHMRTSVPTHAIAVLAIIAHMRTHHVCKLLGSHTYLCYHVHAVHNEQARLRAHPLGHLRVIRGDRYPGVSDLLVQNKHAVWTNGFWDPHM